MDEEVEMVLLQERLSAIYAPRSGFDHTSGATGYPDDLRLLDVDSHEISHADDESQKPLINSVPNSVQDQQIIETALTPEEPPRSGLSPQLFARTALISRWIPVVDPDLTWPQSFWRRWSTRKRAVAIQFGLTLAVFIANLTSTLYLCIRFGSSNGVGSMYQGDCQTADRINVYIHLLINVLSTVLLGASNFCMQLLLAPTRGELDRAHAKAETRNRMGTWWDIGVSSLRNFWNSPLRRRILWVILGISSGGLHLLWNAAVFKAVPRQAYMLSVVTSDFEVVTTPWNGLVPELNDYLVTIQANMASYERLDLQDCVERYIDPLGMGQNLVLVTSGTSSTSPFDHQQANATNTSLIWASLRPQPLWRWKLTSDWICIDNWAGHGISSDAPPWCDMRHIQSYIDSNDWRTRWTPDSLISPDLNASHVVSVSCQPDSGACTPGSKAYWTNIDYCLSEGLNSPGQGCAVQFSIPVMVLVCVLNLSKLVCVFLIYRKHLRHTLVTLGDAVASYLECPDLDTKGGCLLDLKSVSRNLAAPAKWENPRPRLYAVATGRQWIYAYVPACLGLAIGSIPMGIALAGLRDGHQPGALGTVSVPEILGGPFAHIYSSGVAAFTMAIVIANCAQLLLSIVYISFNTMLTRIAISKEWTRFAKKKRKTLRVSGAVGIQRSTYFLSLPYRWSAPLMIVSSLLHWIISQAAFPVRTSITLPSGIRAPELDTTVVGTSVIGVVATFCTVTVTCLTLAVVGFLRYPGGIPFVGTSSLAISAACHPPEEDSDARFMPLQWGVVSTKAGIGHCALSTMVTDSRPGEGLPILGEEYA